MLYFTDVRYDSEGLRQCKLGLIIVQRFHIWALIGSVLLLGLVVIRAVAVWFQVDQHAADHVHDHNGCCDHDHDHEHHHEHHHEHDHPHGVQELATVASAAEPSGHDHDHTHDHGHDHGWAPWRYVVLILPVVLYFLDLPNKGFSGRGAVGDDRQYDLSKDVARLAVDTWSVVAQTQMGQSLAAGPTPFLLGVAGAVRPNDKGRDLSVGFVQLEKAAETPEKRAYYEGKTVRLTGHYKDLDTRRFTLIRYKMNCCAADAIPVKAVIFVDPAFKENLDNDALRGRWVEVTGRVVFLQQPGTTEYATALMLSPSGGQTLKDLVRDIPMDPNPWLN
jgi:hypothetical protein